MFTPIFRSKVTPVPGDAFPPHACLRRRGARWRRWVPGWGISAVALCVLAACATSLVSADRAELRLEGARITIAAPPGLCIDPSSLDTRRAGGFLLISDCALLSPQPQAVPLLNGVISVTVSTGGLDQDFDALEEFLRGPGRAALSRSGQPEGLSVLASQRRGDTLALKVRDQGPAPVPGAARVFWRVFFMAGPRLTSGALLQFEGPGMSDMEALGWLDALAAATIAANPAPAPGG